LLKRDTHRYPQMNASAPASTTAAPSTAQPSTIPLVSLILLSRFLPRTPRLPHPSPLCQALTIEPKTQLDDPSRPSHTRPMPEPGPGNRRHPKLAHHQGYRLRDFAADAAQELRAIPAPTLRDAALRASTLRSLASVWVDACDRIRILRGKPLPGSQKPLPVRPSRRQAPARPRIAGPMDESAPVAEAIEPGPEPGTDPSRRV